MGISANCEIRDTDWAGEQGDDVLPAGDDTVWEVESRGNDILPGGADTIWEVESRSNDVLPAEFENLPAYEVFVPDIMYS